MHPKIDTQQIKRDQNFLRSFDVIYGKSIDELISVSKSHFKKLS